VILRTRGGYNWAERYPVFVRSVLSLRVDSIVLDGEVAVLGANGVSDVDKLHSPKADASATLLAFDVLQLDGDDLRALPLLEAQATAPQALGAPQ
jgi:bifunctional non-homologous end joining protein LigD